MRHAVVVRVKIDAGGNSSHRRAILEEFVIPEAKGLTGFEKAKWMNDGKGIGLSIVLFDTDEHARQAVGGLTRPGGPEVISCEVYEVEIEVALEAQRGTDQ
jgi:hypothetical protein